MPKFSDFDARGYRTVDVRSGYAEWVLTYERTVEDAMDIFPAGGAGEPAVGDAAHRGRSGLRDGTDGRVAATARRCGD